MLSPSKKMLLPALLAIAGLSLTGCAQAEEAARDVASGAAGQAGEAASEAVNAGRDALVDQLCKPVEDGSLSTEEIRLLGGLLDAGRAAGVPAEILDPVQGIADAGDQGGTEASAKLVESLRDGCAKSGQQ